MFARTLKVKLLAAFLVVFVCLNAGGAVCAVYCQALGETAAKASHCPLKMADGHCGRMAGRKTASDALAHHIGKIECCPMSLSFVSAPFEARTPAPAPALVPAVPRTEVSLATIAVFRVPTGAFAYRGPPPRDVRPDRIKHRLLLI